MPKYSAIHVHLFNTTDAARGNPTFRDTAKAIANSAPHLLVADIVNKLQESGFIEVSRNETEGNHSAETKNQTGRFTQLNSETLNLRVWIGFG